MTNFNDRIERLAELEAKASPGPWEYESQESSFSNEICGYMTKPNIEDMLNGKDCDVALSCALRNDALTLLREMAQALSEARAENERLKADAERTDKAFSKTLKDLVLANRESKRFGNQMVLAVNKVCELQAENERLREGIGRAYRLLYGFQCDQGEEYDIISNLEGADILEINDALKQLESLHDA